MPRIRREIAAIKIEYRCDRCERGVFRLVSQRPVNSSYIHKWRHRCTHCDALVEFTVPYPLLEVEGGISSRIFFQRETLPAPAGPHARPFSVRNGSGISNFSEIWRFGGLAFKLPFLGEIR